MEVRIVREASPEERGDVDFIRVSTSADPKDDTVTLATIERIIDRTNGKLKPSPAWKIKTLVMNQPMSVDAAVGLATRYAERKNVPVIYADQSSADSESEG